MCDMLSHFIPIFQVLDEFSVWSLSSEVTPIIPSNLVCTWGCLDRRMLAKMLLKFTRVICLGICYGYLYHSSYKQVQLLASNATEAGNSVSLYIALRNLRLSETERSASGHYEVTKMSMLRNLKLFIKWKIMQRKIYREISLRCTLLLMCEYRRE